MKNTRVYIYVGIFFLGFIFIACDQSSDIAEQECLYTNTCDTHGTEGTEDDVKKTRNNDPE